MSRPNRNTRLGNFAAVVQLIVKADRTVMELVRLTGLHDNVVRNHLAVLREEGLVAIKGNRRQPGVVGRGNQVWGWVEQRGTGPYCDNCSPLKKGEGS